MTRYFYYRGFTIYHHPNQESVLILGLIEPKAFDNLIACKQHIDSLRTLSNKQSR